MSAPEDERGFHLTESERRYRELFGGPAFSAGPARRAYTPGLRTPSTAAGGTAKPGAGAASEIDGPSEIDGGGL